jgi:hypothetical protein
MNSFIEVTLSRGNSQAWSDRSTPDYFVFSSSTGTLRLRKRTAYPQTFAYIQEGWLYFGYGDSGLEKQILNQSLDTVPEDTFYDEEFLIGRINCLTNECTIQRDAISTVPLFIGIQKHLFILSNKYERVYEQLDASALHINEHCLAALVFGEITAGITLIQEIDTLTERSRAIWTGHSYEHQSPPHSSIIHIAEQRNGNPHTFRKRFEQTLDRYWQRYSKDGQVGAELSGGMDSSSICGYYALRGHDISSITLTYHDTYQTSVLHKLAILQKSFGIQSQPISMDPKNEYPLVTMARKNTWQPFYHGETPYTASLDKALAYLQQKGVHTLFQGQGGDELFDNLPQLEQENFNNPPFLPLLTAPSYITNDFRDFAGNLFTVHLKPATIGLIPQSMIIAKLGNNIYLDRDIWPVTPLTDPKLYVYCQSLPIEYRANRTIMQAYLHARGFPKDIYQPTIHEHFGRFFDSAVQYGLTSVFMELMQDSVLAGMGFIDPELAIQSWNSEIASTAEDKDELFKLYCLILIEINLRFLDTTRYKIKS